MASDERPRPALSAGGRVQVSAPHRVYGLILALSRCMSSRSPRVWWRSLARPFPGASPLPPGVGSLVCRIGALAGVVPDALEFCYGLSVEGTPLAGSRLVIEHQPVVVFCPRCLENRTLEGDLPFRCPVCDTPTPELVHGRELELISMELIDHDEPTREFDSNLGREPASPGSWKSARGC